MKSLSVLLMLFCVSVASAESNDSNQENDPNYTKPHFFGMAGFGGNTFQGGALSLNAYYCFMNCGKGNHGLYGDNIVFGAAPGIWGESASVGFSRLAGWGVSGWSMKLTYFNSRDYYNHFTKAGAQYLGPEVAIGVMLFKAKLGYLWNIHSRSPDNGALMFGFGIGDI